MPSDPPSASPISFPKIDRRAVISLAPLIDITFILLIFFMLVTQFGRLAPVNVELGEIKSEPPPSVEADGIRGQRRLVLSLEATPAEWDSSKKVEIRLLDADRNTKLAIGSDLKVPKGKSGRNVLINSIISYKQSSF